MKRLKEKILIATPPPLSLRICPLLFSVSFSSTLSIVVITVVVVAMVIEFFGRIPLTEPSLPFLLRGIGDLSQAEIIFTTWYLLGSPQDVRDQFFGDVYPSFAWMVQYFFYLDLTSHEFHTVKSNDCGLSRSARKSVGQQMGGNGENVAQWKQTKCARLL
jgi:hypothetical protein